MLSAMGMSCGSIAAERVENGDSKGMRMGMGGMGTGRVVEGGGLVSAAGTSTTLG